MFLNISKKTSMDNNTPEKYREEEKIYQNLQEYIQERKEIYFRRRAFIKCVLTK